MVKKILLQLVIILSKKYVMPELKNKSHSILNKMSDMIIESDKNPISYETIGDIRKHADKAIDELFEEWE